MPQYETLYYSFPSLMAMAPADLRDYILTLKNVDQRRDMHPEGNVYVHTQVVVDRVAKYCDIDLSIAAFLHDTGKDRTTDINPKTGMPRSPKHEYYSAQCVDIWRDWIVDMGASPYVVKMLIHRHMDKDLEKNPGMLEHYSTAEWYPKLEKLMEADRGGTDV